MHRWLTTFAALLVGVVGSGLFSHAFRPAPPAQAAIRANLRRVPGLKVEFEIVLPSGATRHTVRYARMAETDLAALEVAGRHVTLCVARDAQGDGTLHATAAAVGQLPGFTAAAEEGRPGLWRLSLKDGYATLRVQLTREYLPA
ncbi:MAG TPA: hypothetical protein VFQ88_03545 [Nevskiaceae bacterium]|nr:hypothetical protein [Nevskiaceae bacterium]